jgi:hypothetical protein
MYAIRTPRAHIEEGYGIINSLASTDEKRRQALLWLAMMPTIMTTMSNLSMISDKEIDEVKEIGNQLIEILKIK